jgi:hypothetical protein
VSRTTFEIYTFAVVAFLIVLSIIFWAIGRGHAIHGGPVSAAVGSTPLPAGAPGV